MDAQAQEQPPHDVSQTKDVVMIQERKDIMLAAGSRSDATIVSRHEEFVEVCASGPDLLFDTASIPSPVAQVMNQVLPQGYVCEPMN
jgi:hypothetical protein